MDRGALIAEAKSIPWFHAIDFGDYVSPGRFKPGATPNVTLLPVFELLRHIDLRGLDVLDIGAADGLVAFGAKSRGARRVVATDGQPRRPLEIARDLLGLDVEYVTGVSDISLASRANELGTFDVVVMAGFLYHLLSPMSAIAAARKLVRPGGLLIIETMYRGDGEVEKGEPTLTLNTAIEPAFTPQPSTFWIGTRSALEGMLKLACFDPLASATMGKVRRHAAKSGRMAYVARAVAPSSVRDREPQLVRTQDGILGTPELNFRELRQQSVSSPVPYTGEPGNTEVPMDGSTVSFPLQPSMAPA